MLNSKFWLLGLGIVGFMALVYFIETRLPDIWPCKQVETSAYCAWCVYRDGEDFTNPASPVYPGPCGPVCAGEQQCGVQQTFPSEIVAHNP